MEQGVIFKQVNTGGIKILKVERFARIKQTGKHDV